MRMNGLDAFLTPTFVLFTLFRYVFTNLPSVLPPGILQLVFTYAAVHVKFPKVKKYKNSKIFD